jgi:hypothetical protein
MTKRQKPAQTKKFAQTNLGLPPDDRALLESSTKRYGLTLAQGVSRALRTRDALDQLYEQMGAEVGGENGRLLRRLAVELGPEWLVNRKLTYIDEDATAHDGPGIQIGQHIFFEDEGGVLHATKTDGSIFRVEDGRLHLIAVIPATNGGIDHSLN